MAQAKLKLPISQYLQFPSVGQRGALIGPRVAAASTVNDIAMLRSAKDANGGSISVFRAHVGTCYQGLGVLPCGFSVGTSGQWDLGGRKRDISYVLLEPYFSSTLASRAALRPSDACCM